MSIELEKIEKRFGSHEVLQGVSLDVKRGELVALLGSSGSGKTTLLRIVAGLESPDSGVVRIEGKEASQLSPRDRRVGFVFQHYALFRRMTVYENVAFGLRVRPRRERPGREAIADRVHKLLALVQLNGLAARLPEELSGGQRQRVALARALAVEPHVLLLDEPFGALDARVRKELRRWLRGLHEELDITTVIVTHDQEEALELADRVVVMNEGRIEQAGAPEDVYHRPASPFVYGFLGDVNCFHARIEGGRAFVGDVALELPARPEPMACSAAVYVRPQALEIARRAGLAPQLRARVERVNRAGPSVKVDLVTEFGAALQSELSAGRERELGLSPGQQVYVGLGESRIFFEVGTNV